MTRNGKYRFLFASALFTGNEAFFQNLKDALGRREDIEITWLPIELSPGEWFARIPPFSLNFSLKNALVAFTRIRALERGGKRFDAAFINHVTPAYFLRGFMKRVPTALCLDVTPRLLDRYSSWYETGSTLSTGLMEQFKRGRTREVYERSRALLPWSDMAKASLMADYGLDEEKILVLPPGINLRLWQPPPTRDGVLQMTRKLNILFVGGHFVRKGGDLLLRVAQHPEFASCEFHMVTKTYQGPRLENVFVHPDISPNSDELRRLYREADIFAFPTRADFSPLAVCEAMAMGLPVVTTDVGALDEIVDHGMNGFLVPVDDEQALLEKLLQLTQDHALRARMSTFARSKAERSFSLESNAAKIVDLLKDLGKHPGYESRLPAEEWAR